MIFKLFHITLASLVYLSSIGFAINRHYCKGELIDAKIYLPAEKCENHALHLLLKEVTLSDLKPCCQKALIESQKGCCEDTSEFKKLEIDNLIAQDWADLDNQKAYDHAFSLPFEDSLHAAIRWCAGVLPDYRPPPLWHDYQVLYQVFRI